MAGIFTSCDSDDEPIRGNKEYTPISMDAAQSRTALQGNKFAGKLFAEMAEGNEDGNTFISPMSITMLLDVVANGADAETQQELADALGATSLQELNSCYSLLADKLPMADAQVEFSSANSIWLDNSITAKDTFRSTVEELFDASVVNADFSSDKIIDQINRWCSDNTRGLIPDFLSEKPRGKAAAFNAVYFNGKWATPFKKANTTDKPFTNTNGAVTNIPTMQLDEFYRYIDADGFSAVSIPYGNGAFSMVVVLPDSNGGLNDLIDEMDETLSVMESADWKYELLNIWLPKFELKEEMKEMASVLNKFGIKRIFDGADYSGMGNAAINLPDMTQKAIIKVDEEGTEAAAVTGIMVGAPDGSVEEIKAIDFHVDHPFMFFITEKSTRTIIFAGAVRKL